MTTKIKFPLMIKKCTKWPKSLFLCLVHTRMSPRDLAIDNIDNQTFRYPTAQVVGWSNFADNWLSFQGYISTVYLRNIFLSIVTNQHPYASSNQFYNYNLKTKLPVSSKMGRDKGSLSIYIVYGSGSSGASMNIWILYYCLCLVYYMDHFSPPLNNNSPRVLQR